MEPTSCDPASEAPCFHTVFKELWSRASRGNLQLPSLVPVPPRGSQWKDRNSPWQARITEKQETLRNNNLLSVN